MQPVYFSIEQLYLDITKDTTIQQSCAYFGCDDSESYLLRRSYNVKVNVSNFGCKRIYVLCDKIDLLNRAIPLYFSIRPRNVEHWSGVQGFYAPLGEYATLEPFTTKQFFSEISKGILFDELGCFSVILRYGDRIPHLDTTAKKVGHRQIEVGTAAVCMKSRKLVLCN